MEGIKGMLNYTSPLHCTFPHSVRVLPAPGSCSPAGRLLPRSEIDPPCRPHDSSAPSAAADRQRVKRAQSTPEWQVRVFLLHADWTPGCRYVRVSPWCSCPAPGPVWRISPAWAQSAADRSGLCSCPLALSASPSRSSPPPAPTPCASTCPGRGKKRPPC